MEKHTAVEYLVEQLLPKALSTEQYYHIEKAKEMEKQQQEQITEESEIHWKTTLVTMTNNEQQTAVEWLFIKLYETIEMKGDGKVMDALLKEAKEIYKQQIIDATTQENVRCTEIANTTLKILGLEPVFMEDDTWGKHYYNNTFEK